MKRLLLELQHPWTLVGRTSSWWRRASRSATSRARRSLPIPISALVSGALENDDARSAKLSTAGEGGEREGGGAPAEIVGVPFQLDYSPE